MSQRKQQSQFSAEALQESAKRQVAEVLHTGEDAVTSGAWIYPIRVSSKGHEGIWWPNICSCACL